MNELGNKIISTEKMLSLRQTLKSWYQRLEKSDKFLAIVHFTTRYKQWGWVYLDLPKIFFSPWVYEFFEHICKVISNTSWHKPKFHLGQCDLNSTTNAGLV